MFPFRRRVGKGNLAVLYKPKGNETKIAAAFIKRHFSKVKKENVKEEIKFFRELSGHKNIVSLVDHYMSGNMCSIVLEYVSGGRSLETLVYNSNRLSDLFTVVTENDIRQIFLQCVNAVTFALDRNICHGNVSPSKILIKSISDSREEKFEVLLSDFRLSTKLEYPQPQMKSHVETAAFIAPEVEVLKDRERNYNYKSDIYSLGKTLYFLLSWGETVWNAREVTDITSANYGKKEINFPDSQMDQFRKVSKSAYYIVEGTTRINPDIRSFYSKIYELSENWKETARTDYDLNRFKRNNTGGNEKNIL